jgi:hypothetical protein
MTRHGCRKCSIGRMGIDSWSKSRFPTSRGQLQCTHNWRRAVTPAPFSCGGNLSKAGLGAIVKCGDQSLIVVGVTDPGIILALAIRPQTAPLTRQEVRIAADDARQLGLRRLTSVISTDDQAVVAIGPEHPLRVVGDGKWLLSRIETTARRSRQAASLEQA